MCAIIFLKKNQIMPYEMLENCVFNNWHSYGLVARFPKNLVIEKECSQDEVDPIKVRDLLKKYEGYDRFLHVRHNTAGATSDENTHPMTVYQDKRRHVEFMHNGTLHNYKSRKPSTVNPNTMVDDDSGPSDTRNFVEKVLKPVLSLSAGDLTNPIIGDIISKYWSTGNRGVLISSDQPALYLGDWKYIDIPDDQIKASNDEYFKEVKRGPEFERREVRRKAQTSVKYTNNIAALKDYRVGQPHKFFELGHTMRDIFDDWDMYDRENCVLLGAATQDELKELLKDETSCLAVMDWAFTDYAKLYDEFLELQEKHEKATKHIATMAEQLKTKKGKAA